MYDGNVRAGNLIHSDVSGFVSLIWGVCQEEEVATVEGRFHGATGKPAMLPVRDFRCAHILATEDVPEHNDDRGLGIRDKSQAFPDHEPGGENRHKVEDL